MQVLSLTSNPSALNDFLAVINAYGAFLKERELVKKFNKDKLLSNKINQLIRPYESDPYSWEARELGVTSGITSSQKQDFINSVNDIFETEKNRITKNLISSEKYYKKLKHKFAKDYPQLNDEMKQALVKHQEYIESQKRLQHHIHSSILDLSERFVSFFYYTFGGGEGSHIAYNSFSREMIKKYNINPNKNVLDKLSWHLDMEYSRNKKTYKLNLSEIDYVASILKSFVDNVSDSDLADSSKHITPSEDGNHTLEEKGNIAKKIINENFERFRKLHIEYVNLKNKI